MKVFLSWSKDLSRAVATSFADWLPGIIQECSDPFISTETTKGDPWFATITDEMKLAKVGIVFITQENANEPWVNFESGALFANFGKQRLCPVLVGIKKSDYAGPLKNLQLTELESKPDTLDLLRAINKSCERPLTDDVLVRGFELQWDQLLDAISTAVNAAPNVPTVTKRSTDEKVDELLELVREIASESDLLGLGRETRTDHGSRLAEERTLYFPSRSIRIYHPESKMIGHSEAMTLASQNFYPNKSSRLKWFDMTFGGLIAQTPMGPAKITDWLVNGSTVVVALEHKDGSELHADLFSLDINPF